MVNQKDILARLQAGESADVIAQELVDALNAANAEFAAAQEVANQKQAKMDYIAEIGELIKDYIMEFHGDTELAAHIADQEIDPEEILTMVDSGIEQLNNEIRKLKQFEAMFGGLLERLEKDCAPAGKSATGKIEANPDAIGAFLKANGLA